MQRAARRSVPTAVLALALVGSGTGVASAKGSSDQEVRVTGRCSVSALWQLKVKQDDAGLEVELQVDSDRRGQLWRVSMADNGTRFFAGSVRTAALSGSFEVERRTGDRVGYDHITARATNPVTRQRCTAAVYFRA